MKKLILLLILGIGISFAGDMSTVSITNLTDRLITGQDTVKTVWLVVSQHDYFNLFMDFGTQGDSCSAQIGYWLYPAGLSNPEGDSTTSGYVRDEQPRWLPLKTISATALPFDGKLYFSGQYPSSDAIAPAYYLQYVIWTSATHDSLTIESANFVRYRQVR
jgi:hypothetical protein